MTERGVHISANNGAVSLAPSSSFRSINGSMDALEQKTHRSTEKSLHVAHMLCHGIITMGIYVSCLCCWLVCLHWLSSRQQWKSHLPSTAVNRTTLKLWKAQYAQLLLFKRSKQAPHLTVAVFLSGRLWQVFYRKEHCCCGCPINDSMLHIRWKGETERKMSLPGCSGANFQYIIHWVVWRIGCECDGCSFSLVKIQHT